MSGIEPLAEIRRRHILQVLRSTKGDLDKAAGILGISTRELRNYMAKHGLGPQTPEQTSGRLSARRFFANPNKE